MKINIKKDIASYSGNFLADYYKTVKELAHSNVFMMIITLVTFVTYGYTMAFHAIGSDDLDMSRFFEEYGLIRQGRFTGQLLHEIFGIMNFHPFFTMAVAMILFIIAAVYTAALLKMISGIKSYIVLSLFTSLMLAFPTNALIYEYILASVLTSLGYILSIFAAVYSIEFCLSKKPKYLIYVVVLTVLSISSYESFVFVYFMIILFCCLFSNTFKFKLNIKSIISFVMVAMFVIVFSTVIESVISNSIINILGLEKIERVSLSESTWFNTESILGTFKFLIFKIFLSYYFIGLLDFSHFYHIIVTVLMFIAVFVLSDKKTRWINLFIVVMINLTIFGISFVDGKAQIPRTAQTLATFVMFSSAYAYIMFSKETIRRIFLVVVTFAIYSSAHLQNMYYEREWQNHVKQEEFMNSMIHDVESEYGVGADIYIIGIYDQYIDERWYDDATLQIYKDTLAGRLFDKINNRQFEGMFSNPGSDYYGYSYYTSSTYIDNFGGQENTMYKQKYIVKYARYLGYDVNECSNGFLTQEQEVSMYEDMTSYPQDGYMKEENGCIYINIGKYQDDASELTEDRDYR